MEFKNGQFVFEENPPHPKYGANFTRSECFFCSKVKNNEPPYAMGNVLGVDGIDGGKAPDKMPLNYFPCVHCKETMKKGVIFVVCDEDETKQEMAIKQQLQEVTGCSDEALLALMPLTTRKGWSMAIKDESVRKAPMPPEYIEHALANRFAIIGERMAQKLGITDAANKLAKHLFEGGQ